ncbi:MAG: hypothetical protein IJB96_05160, partial [Lachnospira sp.]|nr:hypothetical protein [Lachnospira sp.]
GMGRPVQTSAVKQNYTYSGAGTTSAPSQPVQPLPGIKQPAAVTSNVKEKGINIPTFLQKGKK